MSAPLGQEPDAADNDLDTTEVEEGLSVAQLKAQLKAANREAAKRRVEGNQTKSELEEFKKWKDSQKSEVERLTEEKLRAEADLATLRKEKLQREAAREADLDSDLADRVRGDSYEEMLADAKELAERASAKKRGDIDPFAGRRGEPVRPAASTSDMFNNWVRNS